MNLSLDHINSQSPYQISESGGGLLFETENGEMEDFDKTAKELNK